MTAPSCTCGRCHHCGRLLAVDEHSAVCGNGQCPRLDTDMDANENGERGSPYFGDCPWSRREDYEAELFQDRAEARKRAADAEHKAQQLQAELDALKAAHAWINASERLPEDGAKVLAIVREVMILVYDTDTEFPGAPWRTENADIVFNKSSIVKWMPIPGDT